MSRANEIYKLEINEDILVVTTIGDKQYEAYIGTMNYVDLSELGLS